MCVAHLFPRQPTHCEAMHGLLFNTRRAVSVISIVNLRHLNPSNQFHSCGIKYFRIRRCGGILKWRAAKIK